MQRWAPQPLPARIALFGPPLAGKTEIIRAVADEFGFVAETFIGMHGITLVTATVTPAFAVAAVTGARHCPSELPSLLTWSNRLLFVLDPQRAREAENRSWLMEFRPLLQRIPAQAVQVTKTDLAERDPASCFPLEEIAKSFEFQDLPILFSSNAAPASLTGGVRHLLSTGG